LTVTVLISFAFSEVVFRQDPRGRSGRSGRVASDSWLQLRGTASAGAEISGAAPPFLGWNDNCQDCSDTRREVRARVIERLQSTARVINAPASKRTSAKRVPE